MATAVHSLRIPEDRVRRHYFGGERAVLVLAIATLAGAIFLIFGLIFLKLEQRDTKSSSLTKAQVIDKYRRTEAQKTADGETDLNYVYWVRYRYTDAADQTHDSKEIVEFADWDRLQKGDEITVEYQLADPRKSKPLVDYSHSGRSVALFCLFTGTMIGVGTGLIGGGRWFGAFVRTRRIRDGVPVPGEVTQREPRPFPRYGEFIQYRLQYRFTDPSGAERVGKTPWLPRDVACRYASGDSILVLCSPNAPWHSEADVYEAHVEKPA
jgi:hypothetical protein